MEQESTRNNLAAGLLKWSLKRKRQFESNVVTNPYPGSLMAKSWQEIELMYEVYGAQLVELARVKEVFNFSMEDHRMLATNSSFDVAENHFQNWVGEVDGMLVLLDAEIKRRNALIGVIG